MFLERTFYLPVRGLKSKCVEKFSWAQLYKGSILVSFLMSSGINWKLVFDIKLHPGFFNRLNIYVCARWENTFAWWEGDYHI